MKTPTHEVVRLAVVEMEKLRDFMAKGDLSFRLAASVIDIQARKLKEQLLVMAAGGEK